MQPLYTNHQTVPGPQSAALTGIVPGTNGNMSINKWSIVRGQSIGDLNDNVCFTDPFESGEWLGEEVLTVSLKLQLDGSRQTGDKAGWQGEEAKCCLQVQPQRAANEIYNISWWVLVLGLQYITFREVISTALNVEIAFGVGQNKTISVCVQLWNLQRSHMVVW